MIKNYVCGIALVAAMLFVTAGAFAQSDYLLSADSGSAPPDGSVDIGCNLDDPDGENIAGWSWGLCDNSTEVNVTAVVEGSTTMTLGDGGGKVAFHAPALFPDGWTVGVVIDFFGNAVLPPGTGYQLELATYAIDAAATPGSKPHSRSLRTAAWRTRASTRIARSSSATSGWRCSRTPGA